MQWNNRSTLRSLLSKLALIPAVFMVFALNTPACGAEDENKNVKGFDQDIVRREKALTALRRGKAYLEDKSYRQARREFTEALKLNVDLNEARFGLGLVENGSGNHKLALQHFLAVYERDPKIENICLEIARTELALGECSEARSWLERQIEREGKSKETAKLDKEIAGCLRRQEK